MREDIASKALANRDIWQTLATGVSNANEVTRIRNGSHPDFPQGEIRFEGRSKSRTVNGKRVFDMEVRALGSRKNPYGADVEELTDTILQKIRPIIKASIMEMLREKR